MLFLLVFLVVLLETVFFRGVLLRSVVRPVRPTCTIPRATTRLPIPRIVVTRLEVRAVVRAMTLARIIARLTIRGARPRTKEPVAPVRTVTATARLRNIVRMVTPFCAAE